MKSLFAAVMLLPLAVVSVAQSASDLVILSKGTEIKLRMAQTLTSKTASIGERIELQVADDVVVAGALLVPKNTRVLGTVQEGRASEGDRKNSHKIAMQVDYIRLGNRRILVSGTYSDKGKIDRGAVVASTIAFGLTGLVVAMESRTGEIKEGTEIKATVAEDVALLPLATPANPRQTPAATPAAH